MIHRSPIPAPIHGAQRITKRLVATDRRRRRRGDEERGGARVVGRDGEGGIVCRDVRVKVERGGVWFRLCLRLVVGCTRREWFGFAGAGLGRRVGFVVPSGGTRTNARG